MASADDVVAEYTARSAARRAEQAREERCTHQTGAARLVAFAAAVVLTIAAIRAAAGTQARLGESIGAGAFWLILAALVVVGSRAAARARRAGALAALNEQGVHRVRREWSELPDAAWPEVPATHPFAADLDLFGPASLSRLFPPLSAAPGRATLARWLLANDPASERVEVRERQAAVAELAPRLDLRDELALLASTSHGGEAALARLRATTSPRRDPGAAIAFPLAARVLTFVIPAATIALLVAQFRGVVSGPWWLLTIAAGMVLTRHYRASLRPSLDSVTGQVAAIRHFAAMAGVIEAERFQSVCLARTSEALREGHTADALGTLARIGDWAAAQHSPLMHAVLHAVTLWDFHLAARLERWRVQHGAAFDLWLEMVGDVETLSALGALSHDNPGWCFPSEHDAVALAELRATALGHPLIAPAARVCNDVTVGPPGTLLLVTGSNMAGKSTLLRAIGLNVVLAQAGGPVCAAAFNCPRVRLCTSIRVQDSLERGVSYFMAELQRLKLIVDAAAALPPAPALPANAARVLYLLDEMLHGTNSVERAVAARRVLARLVDAGAIGAVTTHDLALADGPPLSGLARQVHFTEQFTRDEGRPRMSFDYILRSGPATSTNALKLLELVGLDE